ncbi:MAG: TonB-dependent receptor, partial [Thermomonas sp.]
AGGINWAYYTVPDTSVATGAYAGQPGRTVNGQLVARGAQYARSRFYQTSSSAYENVNSALYLEDSWNITDNFLAYVGLRWEKFESMNGDGIAWVESDFELAPRLGFSWDVFGDATFKLYGNAGRYYIPVATNSSIRATGSEYQESNWFYVTGWDNATGLPTGQGAKIG